MASTYLTKTLTTPTSDKIFTFSAWVKRSALGSEGYVFTIGSNGGSSPSHYYSIRYANEKIYVQRSGTGQLITNSVYRDLSAWYHIVLTNDTTQATDSNRIKLYVNGELASLGTATYPSQNTILDGINGARCALGLTYSGTGNYFDGSMTHINFIDGLAYDASYFGETDSLTGIWIPKGYSGSYGTNGFFLKGENSGALGTDSSGNGNNFTVNGTPTQTVDTPSNVFATYNPLVASQNKGTLTNGNTFYTSSTTAWGGTASTLGVSKGKWYWEGQINTNTGGHFFGVIDESVNFNSTAPHQQTGTTLYYSGGQMYKDNSGSGSYATFTASDIFGIALNADDNQISIYKNGSAIVTDFALSTTKNTLFFWVMAYNSGADYVKVNFGNGFFGTTAVASGNADDNGIGVFEYAPPTGYLSLCTKNINEQEYS